MHLKNFSLIETMPESGEFILSPAYDLLPVNVIMPEDPEQFALQMNGKKARLKRKHFLAFADSIGIKQNTAEAMIRSMRKNVPGWIKMCSESMIPPDLKQALSELILSRAEQLG